MPAAFDPIASGYDQDFSETPTGKGQREMVYFHLGKLLPPGSHILELSCGTGVDALWLAKRGHRVLATDVSPQMVAQTASKVAASSHRDRVETMVLSAEGLAQMPPDEQPFDLIFSNFAGLNCVAPEDWPQLAQSFAAHTTADGQLAMVLLGRFCWWETFYFLLKGQWRKAWRRRSRAAIHADLGEGQGVDIWYYSPAEITAFCQSYFHEVAVYPIGLFLPPSYLDRWFQGRPRLFRGLKWLEGKLRYSRWGAGFSDHYLVVLRRGVLASACGVLAALAVVLLY